MINMKINNLVNSIIIRCNTNYVISEKRSISFAIHIHAFITCHFHLFIVRL